MFMLHIMFMELHKIKSKNGLGDTQGIWLVVRDNKQQRQEDRADKNTGREKGRNGGNGGKGGKGGRDGWMKGTKGGKVEGRKGREVTDGGKHGLQRTTGREENIKERITVGTGERGGGR